MREEKQGRGCNYENDLEIAMFKYQASESDMGAAEGQKERAGAKIGDQATREGHVMALAHGCWYFCIW
jgi:hypothetical protein